MTTRAVLRGVVQNAAGDVQVSRQVKICAYGTTTAVAFALYDSRTSLVPISATLVTDPTTGAYECWCDGPGGPPVTVLDLSTGTSEVANFVPDSPVTETDTQSVSNKAHTSSTWAGGTITSAGVVAPAVSGVGTLADGGVLSSGSGVFDVKARFIDQGGHHFDVTHPKFGATGDGTTDDAAAIQAAIDAATAVKGGIVYFPPGAYRIGATLTMTTGVNLQGCHSDNDPNGGTGSNLEATRIVWGGTGGGTMLRVWAVTAGHVVQGGGIDGLLFDGAPDGNSNVAGIAVQLKATQHFRIGRLKVKNVETVGLFLDDAVGAINTSNLIEDYEFSHGFANPGGVGDNACGLILDGSTQDARPTLGGGVTVNRILAVRGTFYDGDLVRLKFADNNTFGLVHGIGPVVGGGGKVLRFSQVSSDPANLLGTYGFPAGNIFESVLGPVYVDAYVHGNRIDRHSSEGGSVVFNDKAHSHLAYRAFDYVTLAEYATPAFPMIDQISFGVGDIEAAQGSPTKSGIGNLWSAVVLANGALTGVGGVRTPYHWGSGTITKARIRYSNDAAGGNFQIRFRASTLGYGIVSSTPAPVALAAEYDPGATVMPADSSTARGAFNDITLNLAYTQGDTLDWSLHRIANDAEAIDTNTGNLFIREVEFFFECAGPPNTGGAAAYTAGPPRSSPLTS